MQVDNNKCDKCQKRFSNKSNLNAHKRKNNECADKELLNNKDVTKCKYCGRSYANINKHVCKKRENLEQMNKIMLLEEKNQELMDKDSGSKEHMKTLEVKVKLLEQELNIFKKMFEEKDSLVTKIALQPKTNTTTSTMYNNLSVFDVEEITRRLNERMETVEYTDLLEGQKSLAKIVGPCLNTEDGKSMYMCSDPSRYVFCMKSADGEIMRDQGGSKIVNLTSCIVVPKAKDKLYTELKELYLKPDMRSLKRELIELDDKIKSMKSTLMGVNEKQREYGEYVRYLEILIEEYERKMLKYIEYEKAGYKDDDDYCGEESSITESVVDIDEVSKNSQVFLKSLIHGR